MLTILNITRSVIIAVALVLMSAGGGYAQNQNPIQPYGPFLYAIFQCLMGGGQAMVTLEEGMTFVVCVPPHEDPKSEPSTDPEEKS